MRMPNRVWTLKQVMKLLNVSKHVARTERAGVMGALGGFGGMFDLSKQVSKSPF